MKIDRSWHIQQPSFPNRNETARISTPKDPSNEVTDRGDQASFSVSGLAASTSLRSSLTAGSLTLGDGTDALGSSRSNLISSQAGPYLSAAEVSFFEKIIPASLASYSNTGGYRQATLAAGSSFTQKV